MKSLSVRIRYYTSENSLGVCGLWFASRTKTELREILERHHIDPKDVFEFEINKGNGYEERPVEKFMDLAKDA